VPRTIGDCLYGYISISELERLLLAQPEALRLHRILQNSSVYQTYVNNRGSRFPHSIGAMHVGGRLYKSISEKLDPHDRKTLTKALELLMRSLKIEAKQVTTCLENLDSLYQEYGWTKKDWRDIVLFQGVRLAAMVHDIGHPPYSHVVEFALRDADAGFDHAIDLRSNVQDLFSSYARLTTVGGRDRPDIHEMVGILVTQRIFDRLIEENKTIEPFVRLVVSVSAKTLAADQLGHWNSGKAALQKEETVEQLLPWYLLGQIVSGEVDCDRLDYLRRDAHNSGTTDFGHIDVDRIVRHANATRQEIPIEKRKVSALVPSFDQRSISALETFFYERFRQFRWLVCHHNVVRTDTALNRAMYHLIDVAHRPQPDGSLYELLLSRSFEHLWRWSDPSVDFSRIDDGWLEQLLFAVHEHLRNHRSPTRQETEILRLLNVFLYRQKLPSLWKRLDEYTKFATGVWAFFRGRHSISNPPNWPVPSTHPDFETLQAAIDHDLKDPIAAVRFTNLLHLPLKKLAADRGLLHLLLEIEQAVCNGRYMFVLKPFSAYKGVHVGTLDLGAFSSIVRNLPLMWNEGVAMFAFDREPQNPPIALEALGEQFARAVDRYVKETPATP
jgi:HD superfamily phosphohydrolase